MSNLNDTAYPSPASNGYRWEYDSPTGWGHVLGRTPAALADRLEALAAEALSAANALRVPGGAA